MLASRFATQQKVRFQSIPFEAQEVLIPDSLFANNCVLASYFEAELQPIKATVSPQMQDLICESFFFTAK